MKRFLLYLFTPYKGLSEALRVMREGWRNVDYTRDAAKQAIDDAKRDRRSESWEAAIKRLRPTTTAIRKQVAYRQVAALALVLLAASSIYGVVAAHAWIPGLFGTLISGVWYLTQGLRLYQIRHRTLCSLHAYLGHAVRSPKEFLPLGIPRDWTPLSKEADGESHGDA